MFFNKILISRKFRFDSPPKDKNPLMSLENPILTAALAQPIPVQAPIVQPLPTPQIPNNNNLGGSAAPLPMGGPSNNPGNYFFFLFFFFQI